MVYSGKMSEKENIRRQLLQTGRRLVEEKGYTSLTARKLSEASGCSVGLIYNLFGNMDNFICAVNLETLIELHAAMSKITPARSAYKNLNAYIDVFVTFVLKNSQRWFLLYNFHQQATFLPSGYIAAIIRVVSLWQPSFDALCPHLNARRRRLARQVLWLCLFALSAMLTTNITDGLNMINKKTLCKFMLNTYMAGLAVLQKG